MMTPGPWRVTIEGKFTNVRSDTDALICTLDAWSTEVDRADARLIAAAPDMLYALKVQHRAIDVLLARLIELDHTFLPTKSEVWPMLIQGKAAIDQAEGRTRQTEGQHRD